MYTVCMHHTSNKDQAHFPHDVELNMHPGEATCLPLKPRATADNRCFSSCEGFFTVYSMKYILLRALASISLASCSSTHYESQCCCAISSHVMSKMQF